MTPKELKVLQNIHLMMLELERESPHGFSPEKINALKELLGVFINHEELELRKVSEIAKHLHSSMSEKHYVSFLVPIERLLQKSLRDDEFLILSEDKAPSQIEKIPLVLVLYNLRSAFNVGSIFRTAECFGVRKIFLCGYTPLPTQDKLAKTAMGTQSLIEWQEAAKIFDLVRELKSDGYQIVSLETTSHARPVQEDFKKQPTALIVGNERFGIDRDILDISDQVRKIPLRGHKNSLNVGAALAIATYEFSRQFTL
ncbi:MAG: RNA methyltransferase [Bdellovibrionaceae bacterium]|nr:RNA methyltransferase [Pseudobdellovibrionaceae bacterium]